MRDPPGYWASNATIWIHYLVGFSVFIVDKAKWLGIPGFPTQKKLRNGIYLTCCIKRITRVTSSKLVTFKSERDNINNLARTTAMKQKSLISLCIRGNFLSHTKYTHPSEWNQGELKKKSKSPIPVEVNLPAPLHLNSSSWPTFSGLLLYY